MHEASLHQDVEATLNRLKIKHTGLDKRLQEAHGYAVFPAVGRASTVLGGAAGDGEVFEKGRSIGFANLRQLTVGVQLGGQTFSEILVFDSKEALEHFKTSPTTFTANATALLVKAGGTGTTDYKGVETMAFKEGGELLELSLGGQKFNFQPPGALSGEEAAAKPGIASRVASKFGRHHKEKEQPAERSAQGEGEEEQAPRGDEPEGGPREPLT